MQEHFMNHGVFSWNELITTDLESAKQFYAELLGWTFTETKTIFGTPYLLALKGETMVAGMMLKDENLPAEAMPCWDPYVTVDNVEKSVKQVEELGGEVLVPPTDIPEVGRFAVIKDPQGVCFNIITYIKKG